MRPADFNTFLHATLLFKNLLVLKLCEVAKSGTRWLMCGRSAVALYSAATKSLAPGWLCFSRTITHRCRVTGPDSTHQHMRVSDFLGTAENRNDSVTKGRQTRNSSQVALCYQSFNFNFQKKRNNLRATGA